MKQKGQGIIEFAIIAPMIIALGIAIVYVGIMFLDYTQYSNAARDAARDISLQIKFSDDDDESAKIRNANAQRQYLVDAINGGTDHDVVISRYQHPFTNIYTPTWKAQFYALDPTTKVLKKKSKASEADTVEVTIGLKFADDVEVGEDNYLSKGSLLEKWIYGTEDNPTVFRSLPVITYKMILEQ